MNYLEFLNEKKRVLGLIEQSCSAAIEGYTNLKTTAQQKLNGLPENIDRNTNYAMQYNDYLTEQRYLLQQEINQYSVHIQGQEQTLEETSNLLIEVEEEINSIQ